MKQCIAILILLATAITGIAVNMAIFNGWNALIEQSPNIFIARRPSPTQPAANESTNDSKITATVNDVTLCPIEVICSLKGNAKPGPAQLLLFDANQRGRFSPQKGDMFLVFANNCEVDSATNSTYGAVEGYRIVLMGADYRSVAWTNALAAKPLKEQIKYVLEYRFEALSEELARDQAEKQRVEDGLKELGK